MLTNSYEHTPKNIIHINKYIYHSFNLENNTKQSIIHTYKSIFTNSM